MGDDATCGDKSHLENCLEDGTWHQQDPWTWTWETANHLENAFFAHGNVEGNPWSITSKGSGRKFPRRSCPQRLGAARGGPNPKLESSRSPLDAHNGQEGKQPSLVILLHGVWDVVGIFSASQSFLSGWPHLLSSSSGTPRWWDTGTSFPEKMRLPHP